MAEVSKILKDSEELLDSVVEKKLGKESYEEYKKLLQKIADIANITENQIKALENQNRKEILKLISKNQKINITQIAEKVGLAYKNVHAHIKVLEDVGLVQREKQHKVSGREVYVTSVAEEKMDQQLEEIKRLRLDILQFKKKLLS